MSTSGTTPPEVIEQALLAATRAPSVHNTQPWRFVVASPTTPEHRTLASAISRRVTNRRPFTDRTVPPAHRQPVGRC